ncbi:MAG TPA: hypothetical protein VMH77_03035, partial [Steroidobacteraceae bacterium]|nr:hypothetical protein [Steroidobacteraceae bacterium]
MKPRMPIRIFCSAILGLLAATVASAAAPAAATANAAPPAAASAKAGPPPPVKFTEVEGITEYRL